LALKELQVVIGIININLDFIDLQSFLYLSRVIKYKLSKTIEVVKLDIAKISIEIALSNP
jgi:hypothetical protein